MVKDNRKTKEVYANLAVAVKEATDNAYVLSNGAFNTLHATLDGKPDAYIMPTAFKEDVVKGLLAEMMGEKPIAVYIRSPKEIVFQVPLNDNIAVKIAEHYEKKHGEDSISLEDMAKGIFD